MKTSFPIIHEIAISNSTKRGVIYCYYMLQILNLLKALLFITELKQNSVNSWTNYVNSRN